MSPRYQAGFLLFVVIIEIKTTVVCPATENHVKKYRRQETFLVEEREGDYGSITLPYVEKHCLSVQVRSLSFNGLHTLCVCVTNCDNFFLLSYCSYSGSTTSWRRRPKVRGSCMRTLTLRWASSFCQTSSGTRNR